MTGILPWTEQDWVHFTRLWFRSFSQQRFCEGGDVALPFSKRRFEGEFLTPNLDKEVTRWHSGWKGSFQVLLLFFESSFDSEFTQATLWRGPWWLFATGNMLHIMLWQSNMMTAWGIHQCISLDIDDFRSPDLEDLFALVAHTMQDEYETHSCFSREASIELRECQSHGLWILVNTKTNSYPRKTPDVNWQNNWHIRQLEHSTIQKRDIQNHSFFSTSTFDGRVPGTLGSHDHRWPP